MKNLLRTYRKKTELSMEDVIRLLDMRNSSAISRCERGYRKPNLEIIFTYQFLFESSIEKLFEKERRLAIDKILKNKEGLIKDLKKRKTSKITEAKISFLSSLKNPEYKNNIDKEIMISIYINTAGFGYMISNSEREIIDRGIVCVRPINNRRCLDKIKSIISYYNPQTLVIENYEKANKSERVKKLIDKISDLEYYNLKVFKYSRKEIRRTFGACNKHQIAEKISEIYPEFEIRLPEKRKVWEPENYYQPMYDAASLTFTHYSSVDRNKYKIGIV